VGAWYDSIKADFAADARPFGLVVGMCDLQFSGEYWCMRKVANAFQVSPPDDLYCGVHEWSQYYTLYLQCLPFCWLAHYWNAVPLDLGDINGVAESSRGFDDFLIALYRSICVYNERSTNHRIGDCLVDVVSGSHRSFASAR
jgi:hypothetical protein